MKHPEIILTSFGRTDSEVRIKCYDELMKIKSKKSSHWNDNPFIAECKVCRNRFEGNQRSFTSPKIHTEWRLKRINKGRRKKNEK